MLIEYKKVTVCQKDGIPVLKDVDFHVSNGEFVYIIGKVGSGKSSLLKTIYAELFIDEGEEAKVLDQDMLTNIIAISESTPGPIMVNLATYVGSIQGGIIGALIATLAVILPSFIIILIVVKLEKKLLKNQYVQAALSQLNWQSAPLPSDSCL
jgi:alpha-D-ribose 1-methylphosphonate 5-triphosphate synthase subunit PhnL